MTKPKKATKPKSGKGVQYKNKSGVFTLLSGKLFDSDNAPVVAAVITKAGGELRRVKPSSTNT